MISNREAVPSKKRLAFHFFDARHSTPRYEGTGNDRRLTVESYIGDRSDMVFVGTCIRGNGTATIDVSDFVTGTLTAEVDWVKSAANVVNPASRTFTDYINDKDEAIIPPSGTITLSTEINNTNKTITIPNGVCYKGIHIYNNGTRVAYYSCEATAGATLYDIMNSGNHASIEDIHASFWDSNDNDVPFNYLNFLGYNVPYNLVSLSDLGWTIIGNQDIGRREFQGWARVDGQTDPFGGTNASMFTENDTDSNPRFSASVGRPTLRTGTTYTFSVYLRTTSALSPMNVNLAISGGMGTGNATVVVTDTWQRFSTTNTMTLDDSRNGVVGGFGTVTRGSGIVLFASHPQLVVGSDARPYQSTGILIGQEADVGYIGASLVNPHNDILGNPLTNIGMVKQKLTIEQANCLQSDGTWSFRVNYNPTLIVNNGTDITSTSTVVDNGNSTWDITFPAATQIFNLRINTDNFYPCSEGQSTTVTGFNGGTVITATLVNFTVGTDFSTQNVFAYNDFEGANVEGTGFRPSLTPTLFPMRLSRQKSNAEGVLRFNDSPLMRHFGLTGSIYTRTTLQTLLDSSSTVFGDNKGAGLKNLLGYFGLPTNASNLVDAYVRD